MSLTVIRDIISMKSFTTCPTTGFICAKNILTKYNDTCVIKKDKKEIKFLNQHIARPEFLRSVLSDFDKVASDDKLDLNYLNTLNVNIETKISNMPDMDDCNLQPSNNGVSSICDTYSNDVKFNYMVRKISSGYNKIDNIFVHPLVAIGVAMWMSPTFGNEVSSYAIKACPNTLIYTNNTDNIIDLSFPKKKCMKHIERNISDRLAHIHNGECEILACGKHRIDIITNDYIIEVKDFNSRIKALGQVFYYQSDYVNYKLWIHLFNHNNERDPFFEKTCLRYDIKLTYEL